MREAITLDQMRQAFHDAYLHADTELLRYIEHDSFFVKHKNAIASKERQLRIIAARNDAGQWYASGRRYVEADVRSEDVLDLTLVRGTSSIIFQKQVTATRNFIEGWTQAEGRWCILFLAYDDAPILDASNGIERPSIAV